MGFLCCSRPSLFVPRVRGGSSRAQIPAATVFQHSAKFARAPSPFNGFGLKHALRLRIRPRLAIVFASNTSTSGRDPIKEKSDGTATGDAVQGPPFLTILAGFVVFFLVCWIIGSIVMWLVGLIVK